MIVEINATFVLNVDRIYMRTMNNGHNGFIHIHHALIRISLNRKSMCMFASTVKFRGWRCRREGNIVNGFRIRELRTGIRRKVVIMAETKNNRSPKSRRQARKSSSGTQTRFFVNIYFLVTRRNLKIREPNFFPHSLRCSKREFLRNVS